MKEDYTKCVSTIISGPSRAMVYETWNGRFSPLNSPLYKGVKLYIRENDEFFPEGVIKVSDEEFEYLAKKYGKYIAPLYYNSKSKTLSLEEGSNFKFIGAIAVNKNNLPKKSSENGPIFESFSKRYKFGLENFLIGYVAVWNHYLSVGLNYFVAGEVLEGNEWKNVFYSEKMFKSVEAAKKECEKFFKKLK